MMAKDYDMLWTEPRRKKRVIDAAARSRKVAIEINNHYRIPQAPAFIREAKAAGCRFCFGSNNAGAADLGRCEYGLEMVISASSTGATFLPAKLQRPESLS